MIGRDKEYSQVFSNVLRTLVLTIGLAVFAYALLKLAINGFQFDWLLLSLVTLLTVVRTYIPIPRLMSAVTLEYMFIYLSVLLYGVTPSVALAGLSALVCPLRYPNKWRVVAFNSAVNCLSILISATLTIALFGDPGFIYNSIDNDIIAALMFAQVLALLHYVLNSGVMSLVSALESKKNLLKTWKESFLWASLSYFVGAAAACLILKLITIFSFYAFIISIPILAITHLTYKVYLGRVESSMRHAEQMADLHLRTIEALAVAIDAKDEVMPDHVHRVKIYATGLARLFGLSEPEIEALKAGALLHDIGMLAVPDYILNKPGPVTPAEYDKMKVHTIVGAEILERVKFPYPVVPIVRHHHERWDGRGYPDGLRGDEIPITARILTVADCFDSVREERRYRKAMTREEAVALLQEGSGTIFDPTVVSTFVDHLQEFEAEIREQHVELQRAEPRKKEDVGQESKPVNEPVAFERIRSAHREVITLYDIAKTIGTSLDLRDTFAVFSSRLQDIVSYTTCVLYLVRQDSTELEAAHVSGRNGERFKGRRIPSGAGITGWVVSNRYSMHNCDPRLDFDAARIKLDEEYTTASVAPLMKEDKVLGALALYSAELTSYTADHLRLMEAVAKLASDAIANALHFERTEAKTLTDALTGLPNAKALKQRFEVMASLSRRQGNSLAVVVMDLDDFKKVNDQFGHKVGDQLLRDVAWLISDTIQAYDFIFRYTDDQFVVISEGSPGEFSLLRQRIQDTVNDREFTSGIHIGISIGYACFHTDGETLEDLLAVAATAMYLDKANRKCAALGGLEPPAKNY